MESSRERQPHQGRQRLPDQGGSRPDRRDRGPGLGRPHHHRHGLRPRRVGDRRRRRRQGPLRRALRLLQQPDQRPTAPSSTPATTSPARARATTSRSRSTSRASPPRSTRSSSRSRSTTPTTRSQSFGQVRNAFIRVVNQADGTELARYDLSEDASTETAMVFGELYRNGAEWKFRAVGQGYASGLSRHRPGLRRQRLMAIDYNKRPGASPPDAGGGVSLSKVTLTKAAPSVSLTKRGAGRRAAAGQPAVEHGRAAEEGPVRQAQRGGAGPSTSTSRASGSSPTAARASSRRSATRSRRPTRARRSSGSTVTTAPAATPRARTCSSTCPG